MGDYSGMLRCEFGVSARVEKSERRVRILVGLVAFTGVNAHPPVRSRIEKRHDLAPAGHVRAY